MTLANEFVDIIQQIPKTIEIPLIQEVYIPSQDKLEKNSRKSNFGALKLEDGTVGVVFVSLSPKIKNVGAVIDLTKYIGMNPIDLAEEFKSSNDFQKTLGLGAINAISQYIFRNSSFPFDFTTDSLGLLDLNQNDSPGMVGFFPPLVAQIKKMGIQLVIIEKKANLVQKTNNWEVTLNPARLEECNKILITSTTILNESIDDVLRFCSQAEKISIIGPTAGFFPDPLFSRGVNIVGGTFIHDSNLFMELISKNKRWGPSTKKYCIQKEKYPGITALLKHINK
jgi:uncharacterized protein (DUF4213/DUF364 family)